MTIKDVLNVIGVIAAATPAGIRKMIRKKKPETPPTCPICGAATDAAMIMRAGSCRDCYLIADKQAVYCGWRAAL